MSYLLISVRDDFSDTLMTKLEAVGPQASHALAVQMAKDTEPFVPARTKSMADRTQVVENTIIYPGPYARYLYEGKVMVDSATGKGPMRYVTKDGDLVIRFRKGARLRPTARALDIKTAVNPQAQARWFEGSKAQNIEKWVRFAKREIANALILITNKSI